MIRETSLQNITRTKHICRVKIAKPSLDKIRRKMTLFEKSLINEIWMYFRKHGEWPVVRCLYRDHGKQKVREALTKLGRQVGSEQSGGGRWHRYELRLLGALLSKEGNRLEELLEHLFQFQRAMFYKDPEKDLATSAEVQEDTELNAEETKLLGQLVWIGGFGGGQNKDTGDWSVSAMEGAADFPKEGALFQEVEKWVLRFYEDDPYVFSDQTKPFQSAINLSSSEAPSMFGNTLAAHPSEISLPLKRLRAKYPDPNRLGFLIMRFKDGGPLDRIVKVIKATAKKHDLAIIRADENHLHEDLWGNVHTLLHGCGFGVAVYERIDSDHPNANVGLEVGYLMAMNKPVLLLKDKTVPALPSDLAGKLYVPFDPFEPENSIPDKLTKWLEDNGIVVDQ